MRNYAHLTDEELIILLAIDDARAFSEIYNRYWKKLFWLAGNKLNCLEDAEEVVQDIFVSLWKRRQDLRIHATLNNYLAVSVKYKILTVLDKYHNQQQYIDSLIGMSTADDSTQEKLAFDELRDQLTQLVADLPEKCKVVYQLSREQGLSQKQIAQTLQIAEKTVEGHLNKATKILRAKLSHFLFTLL